MNHDYSNSSIIIQSALALPLAIIVWVGVYVLAYMVLGLLDSVRGLDNDWLQSIFRELFTPGVGGYAAIYTVCSWLSRSNLKFVLWAFCMLVFLFMIGFPIFIILFFSEDVIFSWSEQVIRWLGGAATILGAWLAYTQISSQRRSD